MKDGQTSGFAIIDINQKELCFIYEDSDVSCLCYNYKKNLLFASMEIRNSKKDDFCCKIYTIKTNEEENGEEIVNLEEIKSYKLSQNDVITSIQQINIPSNSKEKYDNRNILDDITVITSSNDSTLEVVKLGDE